MYSCIKQARLSKYPKNASSATDFDHIAPLIEDWAGSIPFCCNSPRIYRVNPHIHSHRHANG